MIKIKGSKNHRNVNEKNENHRNVSDDFDDGRVIADMTIDGMPRPLRGQPLFRRNASFTESCVGKAGDEEIKLTKKERRIITGGITASYLLFGVAFFGIFALFILFCTRVWLK